MGLYQEEWCINIQSKTNILENKFIFFLKKEAQNI